MRTFNVSSFVRSCEPPSGKIPTQPPWARRVTTALYIVDWSTLGIIFAPYRTPSVLANSGNGPPRSLGGALNVSSTSLTTVSTLTLKALGKLPRTPSVLAVAFSARSAPSFTSARKRVSTPRSVIVRVAPDPTCQMDIFQKQ